MSSLLLEFVENGHKCFRIIGKYKGSEISHEIQFTSQWNQLLTNTDVSANSSFREWRALGHALFRDLFEAEASGLSALYKEALNESWQSQHGLSIGIVGSACQVRSFPFELVLDISSRQPSDVWWGSSNHVTVVRQVDTRMLNKVWFGDRWQVCLVAIPSFASQAPIDVGQEWNAIQAVERLYSTMKIVDQCNPGSADEFRHMISDWRNRGIDPQVINITAHGQERDGPFTRIGLSDEQLVKMLCEFKNLQLVILNSCYSGKGNENRCLGELFIQAGIPAVLVWQFCPTIYAVPVFADTFYRRLATGSPIDVAARAARQALRDAFDDPITWASPVVYKSSEKHWEQRRPLMARAFDALLHPGVDLMVEANSYLEWISLVRDALGPLGFYPSDVVPPGNSIGTVLFHPVSCCYVGVVLVRGSPSNVDMFFDEQRHLDEIAKSKNATAGVVLMVDLSSNSPSAIYFARCQSLPTEDDIKHRLYEYILGFMHALIAGHSPLAQ